MRSKLKTNKIMEQGSVEEVISLADPEIKLLSK